MNKTLMTSVAFFSFGLGCVAATVYGPLAVPPARAQQTTRWEQLCVPWHDRVTDKRIASKSAMDMNDPEEGWNRVLKQYGQEGWELVGVGNINPGGYILSFCFKRPL